ncbi:MAG TPA: alpha/beta hydrolase [Xanthobacteraceae bacterium]|nr:alpha/beta hydrolase [Xanthobacteraceae bacterium]
MSQSTANAVVPPQAPAREGLAAIADTHLWYWDTGGEGTPVVLLHPASGSGLIWGYQQPALVKAGYRVIAYSRRSYFNSDPIAKVQPGIGSVDLHGLIEFLGLTKFHLLGSAAGGTVAVDYALSHPDRLLSLTLADNAAGVRDGEIAKAVVSIRTKGFDDMPVEFRELGPSYRAANPEGARIWTELARKAVTGGDFRQGVANKITTARVEAMKVPTLLITGDADLVNPPSILRMVARHMVGSEMLIAPEAGHSTYWEQPDIFNGALLGFLAKHAR